MERFGPLYVLIGAVFLSWLLVQLRGGRVRYHPAHKGHHHHLVCQECGRVIDLDESVLYPLKEILLREYSFGADMRHLAIFGRCANCEK